MNEEVNGSVCDWSSGGITATHPTTDSDPALVGPSTSGELNTFRPDLRPIACCGLYDSRFDFDSSFILPGAAREFGYLSSLLKANPGAPISIFGHADPVGTEDYNKQLSGRRAEAVYAALTRNIEMWKQLYYNPFHGDDWGLKSVQIMLDALHFDPQRFDGVMDNRTRDAVQAFQSSKGLPATGNCGSMTLPKLFEAYLEVLCSDKDSNPYKLDPKKDFLARNADSKGKGDYQGCGEFNPLLIFSQQEEEEFSHHENMSGRNAANAPNRRVLIYLFRPGSKVTTPQWHCPRTREGTAGCTKRFWSDSEQRRNTHLPDKRRTHHETKDTFACRFYDRMTTNSPCEKIVSSAHVRLYDGFRQSIPYAPFAVSIENQETTDADRADYRGIVTLRDIEAPATCVIKWGFRPEASESPELLFSRTIFLIADNETGVEAASRKLSNLGYDSDDSTTNVIGFQLDHGHLARPPLTPTGELDDRTIALLDRVYREAPDDLRDMKGS